MSVNLDPNSIPGVVQDVLRHLSRDSSWVVARVTPTGLEDEARFDVDLYWNEDFLCDGLSLMLRSEESAHTVYLNPDGAIDEAYVGRVSYVTCLIRIPRKRSCSEASHIRLTVIPSTQVNGCTACHVLKREVAASWNRATLDLIKDCGMGAVLAGISDTLERLDDPLRSQFTYLLKQRLDETLVRSRSVPIGPTSA